MFQTTRRRLALWYTTITAIVLLLFASTIYLYVRNTLIERVDDTLHHVVEVVERSLVIEPLPTPPALSPVHLDGQFQINVEASFHDNSHTPDDDHIDLEWFNPQGFLLWSTFSEPLDIPLHPHRTTETVHVHPGAGALTATVPLRQFTDRVEKNHQILGYLRVSHPWFEVTKPIHQFVIDLSLGISIMLISVAAIGWFLSGLAIQPVQTAYLSLKQFTADASHELRNPIAMIQTNVQVALDEPNLDPQHQRQLQVIERLTRRLGKLVDDLLFLARQDSGILPFTPTSVPLDALLMEVLEEQQIVATSQNITLQFEIIEQFPGTSLPDHSPQLETDLFTVIGDWHQLARLFTNLIQNAIQYTPPGGNVSITLQSTQFPSGKKPQNLTVIITDTGIGISPDALPHLFDRFYRVDPARTHPTGAGLGLAIAQAIVDNHQGTIQVDSQPGAGATLTVNLPGTPKPEVLS